MSEQPTASEIQLKIRQLLGQATLLRSRGEHQQALLLAQQALALYEQSWEAHQLVGDLHLALDHPQQALHSYRRARELNPTRPALEERIGRAALAQAAKDRTTELSRTLLEGKQLREEPKRSPSQAALYSFLVPGLGQVYNREPLKAVLIVVLYLLFFAISTMAIRSQLDISSLAGDMGNLIPPQVSASTLLSAAFSGPALIWILLLVGVWIYAIADAALRAGRTMTSDDTGVV